VVEGDHHGRDNEERGGDGEGKFEGGKAAIVCVGGTQISEAEAGREDGEQEETQECKTGQAAW
jgi:hypothetical protein